MERWLLFQDHKFLQQHKQLDRMAQSQLCYNT